MHRIRNSEAFFQKNLSQSAHADSANSDKVNMNGFLKINLYIDITFLFNNIKNSAKALRTDGIISKKMFSSHKIALSSILYYIYKKIKGDIFVEIDTQKEKKKEKNCKKCLRSKKLWYNRYNLLEMR